ncbi:hypothetical protein CH282_22210 [Rhodococcus sp. 06-418-1B]|nr:hypothetical protein CH282_22210 [Rhodococcus sp. 06-418-1B]
MADAARYSQGSNVRGVRLLRSVLTNPGLRASCLLRIQENSFLSRFQPIKSFVRNLNLFLTGADFVPGCSVGAGLKMQHPIGIVVGARAIIGCGATVLQHVTLGESIGADGGAGYPIIGDNVLLGAGCRLLGSIKVGDLAKVGANAVVLKNVPSGATAVGVPAQIVESSRRRL